MTTNIMLAVSGNWFGVAWYWYVLALIALVLQSGFVLIRERQVGIVIKRFAAKSLPPGHLLALEGEAGYQADTLAPGLHSGFRRLPAMAWSVVLALNGVAENTEAMRASKPECKLAITASPPKTYRKSP
jgi:hypothetical protein